MSSLAQEESRSISENVTWGQRKRFADGKVCVPFRRFLGYDRGEDGNLVLNKEEAPIIKRIYGMFLQGMTPYGIAKKLTEDGILTPAKKKNWSAGTVRSILTNEKYKGDALLQKSYTVDFLTKKKKVNEGEIPQYYVENNHEAIIDSAIFDMVQRELEARQAGKNRHSGTHIFAGKIKCAQCGSWYGSKVWHSNSKYRRVVWQCNHKFDGDEKCKTPHLDEETIKEVFIKATNKLLEDKDEIIANFKILETTAFNTENLENKKYKLQNELEVVADLIQNIIHENAHTALDQEEYQRRYDGLVERFDTAKADLELTTEEIKDKITRHKNLEIFLNELKNQDELIAEFDPLLWNGLVDYVTVFEEDEVQVSFKNGIKI
jgi:site-specific DNA recombinase